ncbi:hypothetical protein ABK040_002238 [Willaertia magna]
MKLIIPKYLRFILGKETEFTKYSIWFLIVTFLECLTIIIGAIINIVMNSISEHPSISSYFLSASLVLTGRTLFLLITDYQKPWILTISLIICFFQICQLIICVPLFQSFGWKSYRKLGTNSQLHVIYNTYLANIAILKLDFLFCLTTSLIGLFFVAFDFWYSYLILGIALLLQLILTPIVIYIGIRKEQKIICILFLIYSFFIFPSFLIYQVIIFWINLGSHIILWDGTTLTQIDIKIGLSILIGCALLCRLLLIISTCFTMITSFNKGLKSIFINNSYNSDNYTINNESDDKKQQRGRRGMKDSFHVTSAMFKIGENGEILFNDGSNGGYGGNNYEYNEDSSLLLNDDDKKKNGGYYYGNLDLAKDTSIN